VTPDDAAPKLSLLVNEISAFALMRAKATFASAVRADDLLGDGSDVMVIPGFLASDRTTARLRKSLTQVGYRVHGWGLGRNYGVKPDILAKLDAQVASMNLARPVTIIGWSLGGLIAREYAKFASHRVAKVITLGSPFSGNPRANNAWRLYELVAGHKVDAPPIDTVLSEKPPVRTVAFWSRRDGVVAATSARGAAGEVDDHIELTCRHMAFVAEPDAIRAIIAEVPRAS
jgi:pimeloyl-ACP methyl ester carboxylesterase